MAPPSGGGGGGVAQVQGGHVISATCLFRWTSPDHSQTKAAAWEGPLNPANMNALGSPLRQPLRAGLWTLKPAPICARAQKQKNVHIHPSFNCLFTAGPVLGGLEIPRGGFEIWVTKATALTSKHKLGTLNPNSCNALQVPETQKQMLCHQFYSVKCTTRQCCT